MYIIRRVKNVLHNSSIPSLRTREKCRYLLLHVLQIQYIEFSMSFSQVLSLRTRGVVWNDLLLETSKNTCNFKHYVLRSCLQPYVERPTKTFISKLSCTGTGK